MKAASQLGPVAGAEEIGAAEERVGRPPRGRWRFFIAYYTTLRIVASYLSVKLQSKFRSPAAIEEILRRKHLRNARRIHRTIARLQGLFIKVGQLISIMTNFLPEEFRSELEGLQDRVPPRPYADVERRLREEFDGRGPEALFAEFDRRPVASASIGQVHRATLPGGERVAVKVQYPDIEEIVRIDLRALRRIFAIVSWFIPYRGLEGIYREIRDMILLELDFRAEADNIERIAARFPGRRDVGFPKVERALSTSRVLTTAWIDGIKLNDRARLAATGVDRSRLARLVVSAYCQQIFTDGVYHADPHPGNLLCQSREEGGERIVFLDFGAVAEVSPRMRRGIAELIQAALLRDTPRLIQAMKDMGFIARGADPAIFDRVIDFFHQKFQEEIQLESFSLKDIKFDPERSLSNLADLRRMEVSLRDLVEHFHVPKEWILLERTVLLLMGLCTELDPSLNPMEVIRPYLEEFVLGKDRDWSVLLVDTTKDIATSVLALPTEIKEALTRLARGETEVRFRGIDEHARLLYALGHQIMWTALGIAGGAFGLVLEGHGHAAAARWCWYGAAGAGVLLFWSLLTTRSKLKRRRR